MKILAGLLILAASLHPYMVSGDSAAVAAASSSQNGGSTESEVAVSSSSSQNGGSTESAVAVSSSSSQNGGSSGSAAATATSSSRNGDSDGSAAADTAATAASAAAAAAAAASSSGSSGSATAVAVSTSTSSAQISCNCERDYLPVCGTDARTYSNKCVLDCVSANNVQNGRPPVFVMSEGECPQIPCVCNAIGDPVCGTDDQTYANGCALACENKRRKIIGLLPIRIAYRGVCRSPSCICSNVIIPVCGTDNRTYRNVCTLQCISRLNQANGKPGIGVQYGGPCTRESCICPRNLDPLCASDGNTYDNSCILQCQNRRRDQCGLPPLTVQYRGKCVNCFCPDIYNPVCANGVTFFNTCFLNCENKKRKDQNLPPRVLNSRGVCPCICTLEYNPVCGTDERTYSNRCRFDCENKRRRDLGLRKIFITNYGPCICECNHCLPTFAPLCGNDGRTYLNRCFLNCSKVCNPNLGRPIAAMHNGPC